MKYSLQYIAADQRAKYNHVEDHYLWKAVFGEDVEQCGFAALTVPNHDYLTLHTLTGIHSRHQARLIVLHGSKQ